MTITNNQWLKPQLRAIIKARDIIGKDENIGNHGYIGTSILRIYRRYIDGYFGKKYQ